MTRWPRRKPASTPSSWRLQGTEPARLLAALKQAGVELKSTALFQGYGPETLEDPSIAAALEGTDMLSLMGTVPGASKAATKMQKNLNKAGVEGTVPSFGAANGYVAMDLILSGLELLGAPAENTVEGRQAFIDALRTEKAYTGDGLLSGPSDLSLEAIATDQPAGPCIVFVELTKDGTKFKPIRKKPFCGELIPGTDVITGG